MIRRRPSGPSWIVDLSITDSSRAPTPYSGTLNHPAPHEFAKAQETTERFRR